jgi:ribonuclease VapC
MIVDSSALVAIVTNEPGRDEFIERILSSPAKRMSAASYLETAIVLKREKGALGMPLLDQLISETGIEIVALTRDQARIAHDAYLRFGKGMGHPAQLNILDCCTYALAAQSGEPVLFTGADFGRTDIQIVNRTAVE